MARRQARPAASAGQRAARARALAVAPAPVLLADAPVITPLVVAFPLTPILDTFNRANAPTLGANWGTAAFWAGFGLSILSNGAVSDHLPTQCSGSYWTGGSYGPDCEFWALIRGTFPDIEEWVEIDLLTSANPTVSGTEDGFWVAVTRIGTDYRADLGRYTAGVGAHLANASSPVAITGIGFRRVGSTLQLWVQRAGAWAVEATVINTTSPGALYPQIGVCSVTPGNVAVETFGGGTYVTPTDMTTFPFTETVPPTIAPGQEFWYRYDAPGTGGLSVFAGRTDTTYNPETTAYYASPDAPGTLVEFYNSGPGYVMAVALLPGFAYYFKVTSAITSATATLNWQARLKLGLPENLDGYLFIPPDTGGPDSNATVVDPNTGEIVGVIPAGHADGVSTPAPYDFPAGERGAALGAPYNRMILPDKRDTSILWIYSTATLQYLLGPIPGALVNTDQGDPGLAPSADTFYVGQRRTATSTYAFTAIDPMTGAIVGSWTAPIVGSARINTIGVTADNTILYYVTSLFASPIRAWDLVNNVALPDPIAGVSAIPLDLLVLADQSIVVSYTSGGVYDVRHYSPAGALLHTYLPTTLPGYTGYIIDHLQISNIAGNFWVWLQKISDSTVAFVQYRASDGAVVSNVTTRWFGNGVNSDEEVPAGAMPVYWFGVQGSCPLMTLLVGDVPCPGTRQTVNVGI